MTAGGWGDATAAPATPTPLVGRALGAQQGSSLLAPSTSFLSPGLTSRENSALGCLGVDCAPQDSGSNIHRTESILCGQRPPDQHL